MKVKQIKLGARELPETLRNIPQPPRQLYVLGDLDRLMSLPRIGVVGSRKITPYGREVTARMSSEMAGKGFVIVSGLALGVDSIAHQAALDANGLTIAVMPCGLDKIYPSSHYHLAQDILKRGGAIVSEYPPGMPALLVNFIARNRLVSGLSDGLLITEAAIKSGTIHTANFALEQGRPVMAVPGNINNPMSQGTNNLIKSGATMVTDTDDILLALGYDLAKAKQRQLFGSNEEETCILQLIQSGISDASELMEQSGYTPVIFNQTLTMLEINGQIHPLGASQWALK